jgi:3-oxoacyl-[acyl-carrier protein] reductase
VPVDASVVTGRRRQGRRRTVAPMELSISGRRAAVAAATSGLGLASAVALAAEGVHVAICGRDPDRLAAAAETVGHGCVPIVADVSTPHGAARFVEESADALGAVDILVPNAGGPPPGTFASTPVDAYPAALELNLLSIVAMCKAAVPAMQERRWGRVVAITSLSVRQPMGQLILSNTARAGATGFLKTLALEVAGRRGHRQQRPAGPAPHAEGHRSLRRGAAGLDADG